MENHLVLYQAGHVGTYLVWLINQHKNFSQYDYQWKYTDAGNKLDLGCYGADWNYVTETFAESRSKWEAEYNECPERDLEQTRNPRNRNRTKDGIKLLPNHCCQLDDVVGTIDRRLLKNIIGQVQPKSIIVPVLSNTSLFLKHEILNRWVAWGVQQNREENDKSDWEELWFNKQFPWVKDNVWRYGDNAHTINISKIIMDVESEYLKLCEIINEEPLSNIKELTRPIRELLKTYKN